jgi:hypothetical protein
VTEVMVAVDSLAAGSLAPSCGRRVRNFGRLLLDGLERLTRRPNGVALEGLGIRSSENFSSHGEGRALAVIGRERGRRVTGKRSRTPLESLSLSRRYAKSRSKWRRPQVQDFPGNPLRPTLRTLRATPPLLLARSARTRARSCLL